MANPKHIELLEQAKHHYAADMLQKGSYGEFDGRFRGCSVGCLLQHIRPTKDKFNATLNCHAAVAEYYEYPEWLARLQDTVFENLPDGEHAKWHVQLAEAIASRNGDIDWQKTLHRVFVGILRIAYDHAGENKPVVKAVIDLHETALRGEPVSDEEWDAARATAWDAADAARDAAWDAARATAWDAAYMKIRDVVLDAIASE